MEFSVSNTNIYGLERSVKASGNPMRTHIETDEPNEKDYLRAETLGSTKGGEGHDNFLHGIIVQMDLVAPLYMWKEIQRYHWMDFISSQSTMHKLTKFDVKTQCVSDTDSIILDRISQLIDEYTAIPEDDPSKKSFWRKVVASLPCGFCLGATMTTNYQQLKTIFNQRKYHKLKEWHEFCDWCLTLPKFSELTGCIK